VKNPALKSVITGALALPLALGAAPAHAADSTGHGYGHGHGKHGATRYAALGDSFSSGVGAGSYFPESGTCYRSPYGYPYLWTVRNQPRRFRFLACSGATTDTLRETQVPRLRRSDTLVTLTVCGNDVGFSRGVAACVLPGTSSDEACAQALEASERTLRDELPGKLRSTYREIAAAAPKARVVLAGYPHLLEEEAENCPFGTAERRSRINELTDQVDELIRKTGEEQGFRFADVRRAFAGHGVCAATGEEWINAVVDPQFASFHPNRDGYRLGYLPVVSRAVGRPARKPIGKQRPHYRDHHVNAHHGRHPAGHAHR
jgi:lysophospholipase L1-like esterase